MMPFNLIKEVLAEICSDVHNKNYGYLREMLEQLCKNKKNREILQSYLCADIPEGREKYYDEV